MGRYEVVLKSTLQQCLEQERRIRDYLGGALLDLEYNPEIREMVDVNEISIALEAAIKASRAISNAVNSMEGKE